MLSASAYGLDGITPSSISIILRKIRMALGFVLFYYQFVLQVFFHLSPVSISLLCYKRWESFFQFLTYL